MADYRTIFIVKNAAELAVEMTEADLNIWLQEKVREAQCSQHVGVTVTRHFLALEKNGFVNAYGYDVTRLRLCAEHCPVCGEFCESDVDTGNVYRGINCGH